MISCGPQVCSSALRRNCLFLERSRFFRARKHCFFPPRSSSITDFPLLGNTYIFANVGRWLMTNILVNVHTPLFHSFSVSRNVLTETITSLPRKSNDTVQNRSKLVVIQAASDVVKKDRAHPSIRSTTHTVSSTCLMAYLCIQQRMIHCSHGTGRTFDRWKIGTFRCFNRAKI